MITSVGIGDKYTLKDGSSLFIEDVDGEAFEETVEFYIDKGARLEWDTMGIEEFLKFLNENVSSAE